MAGLVAFCASNSVNGQDCLIPASKLKPIIEAHPKRFFGLAGVNPLAQIQDEYYAPRYLERAVKEYGFKAAHLALHWFDMQPSDKRLYPIYEKCLELGIPIVMPLGAAPPRSGARNVAEPHLLDPVIGDFLEFSIVGQSIGYPWERESVYCPQQCEFQRLANSPAPEHWIADFVGFIKQGRFPKHDAGSDQVMWGSGFPFKDPKQSRSQFDASLSPTLSLPSYCGRTHSVFSNLALTEGQALLWLRVWWLEALIVVVPGQRRGLHRRLRTASHHWKPGSRIPYQLCASRLVYERLCAGAHDRQPDGGKIQRPLRSKHFVLAGLSGGVGWFPFCSQPCIRFDAGLSHRHRHRCDVDFHSGPGGSHVSGRPDQVNLATGTFFTSMNVGLTIALFATPIMAASFTWRTPLNLFAGFSVLVALVFFLPPAAKPCRHRERFPSPRITPVRRMWWAPIPIRNVPLSW